jgi:hypothetical protein
LRRVPTAGKRRLKSLSWSFSRPGRSDESSRWSKASSVTQRFCCAEAVYDPKESRIGDIDDVLVDKSGKVTGLVLGVGGFLGAEEKDIIVPFAAVKTMKKNDKWWLTLDETKDDLKNASGFNYNKASTTWVPEKK